MKNISSKYTSRIGNEYQIGFKDEVDDFMDELDRELDEIYGAELVEVF